MKAIVYTQFGPPEVLHLKEVERPALKEEEVLVRVHASSVNHGDWSFARGKPFLVRLIGAGVFKPRHKILGADIAGRVEAVGINAKQFQPGEEVFGDIAGHGFGGFAEYAAVPESLLALKPANATFEEAAAVPQAAVVALQGLRDVGQIKAGQKVLIHGASGGIGTFAVQIAKSFGADVTGVCSTRNLELVRLLGADQVIDYTQEDYTQKEGLYDLILDIVANLSVAENMRALNPFGIYVPIAFNPAHLFQGLGSLKTGGKQMSNLPHRPSQKDLVFIKELIEAGKVISVIDRSYPLLEVPVAVRHYGEGHPRGKVVINVMPNNKT